METHRVETDDGWTLRLDRYPGDRAVLFVHGMGANHHNFDLNERHSLALYLHRKGFDCWVVELRGRGESVRRTPGKEDWQFEDFLHRDMRRVVSFLRERGCSPVHWIGHSMGGMLGVAFAECYGQSDLRSLSLFGTPLRFGRKQWMLKLWGSLVQVHRFVPTLDQEKWGRRLLPLMARNRQALQFFLRFLANPDNVDTETILDIFDKLVTNEAPGIILQFSDWVRSGHVRSADRGFDYTDHLHRMTVPALFVCGVDDLMAPPRIIARQIDRLGTRRVRQVVLSRKNGYRADYGHGDLIIGRHAPDEVYPLIAAWIDEIDAQAC
ncbi:MAG: alpha/beta hydrolase [Deltaproteobacteria bacterium]|nr:alpha/beta hydrolase [Deltaproteobacteria bacterium]